MPILPGWSLPAVVVLFGLLLYKLTAKIRP